MKTIQRGDGFAVPAVAVGCMRMASKSVAEAGALVEAAMECGMHFFDHADIYGGGGSERVFAAACVERRIPREAMILQGKCGIVPGAMYDSSRDHILAAVDGSLQRLGTEYLDVLLLHRPDALAEPEEMASAFDALAASGKVRRFGVSNHSTAQFARLQRATDRTLEFNQLQFGLMHAGLVTAGLNANLPGPDADAADDGWLDFAQGHDVTIQAWSPFQFGFFGGNFLDHPDYPVLNEALATVASEQGVEKSAVAAAWILRHPARMQVVAGTMNPGHLRAVARAADVVMDRRTWYALYRAAGHRLP